MVDRLNAELRPGTLADDREELLAKARAAEHRRRHEPPAPLSAQERHEAEELASNRRTVWLPEPIVDPVTGRIVVGYDPHTLDQVPWLAEILNIDNRGGKDADSTH
jgi:hypothetical protein